MTKTLSALIVVAVFAPSVALAQDHEMAEMEYSMAAKACYDQSYDPSGAEGTARAYQEYKTELERAFKNDPNIAKSTRAFSYLRGSDRSDPTLTKRSMAAWIKWCDDWFPKQITERNAKAQVEAKHDSERKQKEAIERDAATKHQADKSSWDAAYGAKLKSDRKRLWKDRGWPDSTSVDEDAPYETEASYAKTTTAKWWRYQSMQNSRGEYLCTETFYFSGNKRTKRTTEGICH